MTVTPVTLVVAALVAVAGVWILRSVNLPFNHPKTTVGALAIAVSAAVACLALAHPRLRLKVPRGSTAGFCLSAMLFGASALATRALSNPHFPQRIALPGVEAVRAAQLAYKEVNQGYFESRLGCLSAPWACIPGYPSTGRSFLDERFAREGRVGWYDWTFYPGPAPAVRPQEASATSCVSFAYTVVPHDPLYTGRLAFCADSLGVRCLRIDGAGPAVTPEGSCDLSTCEQFP